MRDFLLKPDVFIDYNGFASKVYDLVAQYFADRSSQQILFVPNNGGLVRYDAPEKIVFSG